MLQRYRRHEDYINFINFILTHEEELRDAVNNTRLTSPPYVELRNQSSIADPTAMQAVRNLTPLDHVYVENVKVRQPEKWLETLEVAYQWCKRRGEIYYKAMKLFFVQQVHYSKICAECSLTQDKFYDAVEKFRQRTIAIASYNHLVKPF